MPWIHQRSRLIIEISPILPLDFRARHVTTGPLFFPRTPHRASAIVDSQILSPSRFLSGNHGSRSFLRYWQDSQRSDVKCGRGNWAGAWALMEWGRGTTLSLAINGSWIGPLIIPALTSTAVKKGGLSTGDVAAQYKYKNTLIDVKVDTESNYYHDNASLASAITLRNSPSVDFSLTLGTPTFAIGAEAGYETSSGTLTKYNAGISVTKPDPCASIILGDKGDTIKASYVHHLGPVKKSAAVGEIARRFSTNENTFTIGGACAVDPLTVIKMRLNNHGRLGALLQHEFVPKSVLSPVSLTRRPWMKLLGLVRL